MTVQDFLAWAEGQQGRYELVDGEPLRMAPERALHNVVKGLVFIALRNAVRESKLPCQVFTDGMTVQISETVSREPDAAVQCGVKQDMEATILTAPLIVVEVVSPSNAKTDTTVKLAEYFSVATIEHYLIVVPDIPAVIHHQRDGDCIQTRIHKAGAVKLDPPGLYLPIVEFWPE